MDTLYKEELLEHYFDPRNFFKLDTYSVSAVQKNPFCGDEIEMYIVIQKKRVSNIAFTGKGCAVAIGAASILTESIKGKTIEELTLFSQEDMLTLIKVPLSDTRKKCGLLSWGVLQEILTHYV